MVQPIMIRKTWWWEHETAGHIASAVRKQRADRKCGQLMDRESSTSSDLLPPGRLHLLEVLQPLKQSPQLRPSVQTHEPIGKISHSSHSILQAQPLTEPNHLPCTIPRDGGILGRCSSVPWGLPSGLCHLASQSVPYFEVQECQLPQGSQTGQRHILWYAELFIESYIDSMMRKNTIQQKQLKEGPIVISNLKVHDCHGRDVFVSGNECVRWHPQSGGRGMLVQIILDYIPVIMYASLLEK